MIRLSIGDDAGGIRIQIRDRDGRGIPDGTLAVANREADLSQADALRVMTADQDGLLELHGLKPGVYRTWAMLSPFEDSPGERSRLIGTGHPVELKVAPREMVSATIEAVTATTAIQ